jgi:acetyltransferase-like isoleucine patch superfamily enzyme
MRTFLRALSLYLGNHLVAGIPSFGIRHWYYRHILRYDLRAAVCIHMGVFFTGDNVRIGANTIVNRRCYLDGRIGVEIGENCSISPEVCILSMDHDPQSPEFAVRRGVTRIGAHCWIGARAMILAGVTIGEGAVIGAGAVVTRDIAPYRIAVGNPAREIKDRMRDIRYRCRYYTWMDTDLQI